MCISSLFFNILFYIFIGHAACESLVPQPGIETMLPPLGV